jgi:hypothetical protein
MSRAAATGSASVLWIAAVYFKLAFTHEDAPEQLGQLANALLAFTPPNSLLHKARAALWALGIAVTFTLVCEFLPRRSSEYRQRKSNFDSSKQQTS